MDNKSKIINQYDNDITIYQRFVSEMERLLQIFISTEKISYNAITSRLKDRNSLIEKIDRKNGKYTELNDVTDIAGVRVITYYAEDVDKVADIVEHEFDVDQINSIDKGKALEPDRFGYCSVHYVVKMSNDRLQLKEYQDFSGLKCEIQIRSVLQHAWAEIEHDLGYKKQMAIPKSIRRSFSRLAGLLEIADKEFQDIRASLLTYESEISKKIESDKNIEIDAILLSELSKNNSDIITINRKIKEFKGEAYITNTEPFEFEDSVSELHWFGIHTLEQLYLFIERNSDYAIKIAEIFMTKANKIKIDDDEYYTLIHPSIAFFYLCYAELVLNEEKYDIYSCEGYLESQHIGNPWNEDGDDSIYEIAKNLINLRETLKQTAK